MDGAELCRNGGGGIRRAASVGGGGGGGFLVGCDGTGFRANEDGTEEPFAGVELFPGGGGVSSRVPANKSKSSKSRMTALGAEPENADNPSASGGDVERGASSSCVAGLLVAPFGAAMEWIVLFSAGGVGVAVSALFELEEAGGSACGPPTLSSCLLHRSSRYAVKHFSMMVWIL